MSELPSIVCRDCHATVVYRAGFFREKNLAPPVRCWDCRGRRREARVTTVGTLFSRGPWGAFIRADGGETFYAAPTDSVGVGLAVGARVLFEVAPNDPPPAAGRQPLVYDVRRA